MGHSPRQLLQVVRDKDNGSFMSEDRSGEIRPEVSLLQLHRDTTNVSCQADVWLVGWFKLFFLVSSLLSSFFLLAFL